jgi:polar amino acid transport system substrate-binding protein
MYTEELSPYNFTKDERLQGISVEILVEMFARTGEKIDTATIQCVPWSRGLARVKTGNRSILFSTARLPERESFFRWVGPIDVMQVGLVGKKTQPPLSSLEEINTELIGTMVSTATETLLLKKGVKEHNIDRFLNLDTQVKKLENGRVDFIAFSVPALFYEIVAQGLDIEKYTLAYPLSNVSLYFAFSLDTPTETISILNASLESMRKDGTIDAIKTRYGQ